MIAPQDYGEADAVLRARAEAADAAPVVIGTQDFAAHEENGRLVYQDERGLLDLPRPRLFGRHQIGNAGTAVAALRAAGAWAIGSDAFEAGMLGADWPGRLQRLTRGRLPGLAPPGAELWLDGGHNLDGGRVARAGHGGPRGAQRRRPSSSSPACSAPRTPKVS